MTACHEATLRAFWGARMMTLLRVSTLQMFLERMTLKNILKDMSAGAVVARRLESDLIRKAG